jgi:hypothetical protein
MVRDSRVGGGAFEDLVRLLSDALGKPDQFETVATMLDLASKVSWDGDAERKWTSLLNVAAERPSELDRLLNLIEYKLKGTVYWERFLRWRGQASNAKLANAVADLRESRKGLLDISDPRKAQVPLGVMRSTVIELSEIAPEKLISERPLLADDPDEVAAARSEVSDACRNTLAAVDQLMVGITDARRQSPRIRQAYGGQEAFIVERSVVRHLLDDRSVVDLESQTLLQILDERLKHLVGPISQPHSEGGVAPQQNATP